MSNEIQPINVLTGIIKCTIDQENHRSNAVITRSLGQIEKCVTGYSAREGFFGKLEGLIYRVWNAVKSIFGQSDWQKGRSSIENLIKTGVNHPVIENLIKETRLAAAPVDGADVLLQFEAMRALVSNYNFESKDLDEGLEFLVKLNENQGLKNILNNDVLKGIFGDSTNFMNVISKINNIFMNHTEEIVALYNTDDPGDVMGKIAGLAPQILQELNEVEGLQPLVRPILDNISQIFRTLQEGKSIEEAFLPLLENPQLSSVLFDVMNNLPKIQEIRER